MRCYLCDNAFNNSTTLQHGEHIIQNSIGGALISHDILCEACGMKLGDSVDKGFALALSPLTVLLQPPRDRGDRSQTKAQLMANTEDATCLESVQFTLKNDFSVVPTRPLFLKSNSRKTITVLAATLEQAEQYAESPAVRSELVDGYTLELSANAANYAESLLITASPNSIEILRGVLKIAIGYASHNGIERKTFAHLLIKDNLTNSDALLRSSVFTYYPTSDVERFFETEKHTHEDWYPTHHLYLFSQDANLYCYVELFGSIQKYVHLSDSYSGPPITKKFVQKAEKWDFNERIYTAKDPKDLHILAGEFNVTTTQRSLEEIQTDVLNRARCRAYSLEPDETVEKVKKLVLLLAQFSFLKNGEQFEIVRSLFDKADKAKVQLGLTLLEDLKADPMIAMTLIRHTFEDFRMGDANASRPNQVRQVSQAELDKYVAYKFYELLRAKGKEALLQYKLI